MGGTGAIIRAFEKLMKEEKIKINKNTDVKEVIFEDNKAIGVKLIMENFMVKKLFLIQILHIHINTL